jgi:hypothetical protein
VGSFKVLTPQLSRRTNDHLQKSSAHKMCGVGSFQALTRQLSQGHWLSLSFTSAANVPAVRKNWGFSGVNISAPIETTVTVFVILLSPENVRWSCISNEATIYPLHNLLLFIIPVIVFRYLLHKKLTLS